jgi:hypothetical protein
MAKNSRRTAKVIGTPFEKGESGNPNGRPLGQRNYATIYREALIKIASTNNKTPEEIEEMMHQVGLNKALKGDYAFYRDVMDRLHGKPLNKTDVTSGGDKIQPLLVKIIGDESDNADSDGVS